MEFVAGGRELGRITIELRADIVPICAENVRQLCTGERGKSRKTGVTLHYKGSTLHRIVQVGSRWRFLLVAVVAAHRGGRSSLVVVLLCVVLTCWQRHSNQPTID